MRVAPAFEPPPEELEAVVLLDPQDASIVPAMMIRSRMVMREIIRFSIFVAYSLLILILFYSNTLRKPLALFRKMYEVEDDQAWVLQKLDIGQNQMDNEFNIRSLSFLVE